MWFLPSISTSFPKAAMAVHSAGRHWSIVDEDDFQSRCLTVGTETALRLTGKNTLKLNKFVGKPDIFNKDKITTPYEGKIAHPHPILVAEGISNCQVIIIKQNDAIWMLHTSPAAIDRLSNHPFFASVPPDPYLQVAPFLDKTSITQVCVIPSPTYRLWNESSFLSKTGLPREHVSIEILNPIDFHENVASKRETHHVGYDVVRDELWFTAGYRDTTAHRFDNIFKHQSSSNERTPSIYTIAPSSKTSIKLIESTEVDDITLDTPSNSTCCTIL